MIPRRKPKSVNDLQIALRSAVLLSYLAANYLFIEPRGIIAFNGAGEVAGLLLYLLSCLLIIALGEAMRAARRRAEAGHRDLLLKQRCPGRPRRSDDCYRITRG